jgi:protein tyrosine phosphatase
MVTDPDEKGEETCGCYWEGKIGKYSVSELSKDSIIKEDSFEMIKKQIEITQEGESKTVPQLQIVGWPDHGIVHPDILAGFVREVKKKCGEDLLPPLLVHCKDGSGRRGTLLATLKGINREFTDIFQIVNKMRPDRIGIVETEDQYDLACRVVSNFLKQESEENCGPCLFEV